MSEMIDRIADILAKLDARKSDMPYDDQARLVIAAMREPTSEMVRYGETAGYAEVGHKLMQADGRKFADASYRAMNDAALRTGK